MDPASIAFVIPLALTLNASELISILLSSTFTDNVDEPPNEILAEVVANPSPAVTVTALLLSLLFAMEPASIVFVTESVSPVETRVPTFEGSVRVISSDKLSGDIILIEFTPFEEFS